MHDKAVFRVCLGCISRKHLGCVKAVFKGVFGLH